MQPGGCPARSVPQHPPHPMRQQTWRWLTVVWFPPFAPSPSELRQHSLLLSPQGRTTPQRFGGGLNRGLTAGLGAGGSASLTASVLAQGNPPRCSQRPSPSWDLLHALSCAARPCDLSDQHLLSGLVGIHFPLSPTRGATIAPKLISSGMHFVPCKPKAARRPFRQRDKPLAPTAELSCQKSSPGSSTIFVWSLKQKKREGILGNA